MAGCSAGGAHDQSLLAEVLSCRRRRRGATVCFMFYLGLFNVRVPSLSVPLLSLPYLVFAGASRLCSVVRGDPDAALIPLFDKRQPPRQRLPSRSPRCPPPHPKKIKEEEEKQKNSGVDARLPSNCRIG